MDRDDCVEYESRKHKDGFNELDKLQRLLDEKNIKYVRSDDPGEDFHGQRIHEFHQIKVKGQKFNWDAICHPGSYGYEKGLLEYQDDIEPDVIGHLTADDVIELVETSEYRRRYQDAISLMASYVLDISKLNNLKEQ